MEKCSKCGTEFLSGTLTRDTVDAALLYCEKCRPKEKKPRKLRKPRKRKETPVIATAAPPVVKFVEPPPVPPQVLKKDAEAFAIECGLSNVSVQDPAREEYPQYGFGYVVQVMERGGKERRATVKYTAHGKRSYWQMDGMVTG